MAVTSSILLKIMLGSDPVDCPSEPGNLSVVEPPPSDDREGGAAWKLVGSDTSVANVLPCATRYKMRSGAMTWRGLYNV